MKDYDGGRICGFGELDVYKYIYTSLREKVGDVEYKRSDVGSCVF